MSSQLFLSLRKGTKDNSVTPAPNLKIISISSLILIKHNSGEALIKNTELLLLTT